MTVHYSLKQRLSTLVYDWPRFLWCLRPRWLRGGAVALLQMRNRDERITTDGCGVQCEWRWTSSVHLANVFPQTGKWLLQSMLREWPVRLSDSPAVAPGLPQVSFIIGHRGRERLPHLLATLRSIAAQDKASFECVVVEQSLLPEIMEYLPAWVRYVHSPSSPANAPYCRSATFNVGAAVAKGELFILHDNDLLIPQAYAAECWHRYQKGAEVINLKRYLFYLAASSNAAAITGEQCLLAQDIESVLQNATGGASVAISRDAYFAIGGMDEEFVGWGGEDVDFWDRALTRRVSSYACLPMVHLWHPPQPGKREVDGNGTRTASLLRERSAIPAARRIEALRLRPRRF